MSIQELAELSLKKAVLIDFWAEWCGPCKTFGPILEETLAKYKQHIHLEKVDVDKQQDLAAQFGVQSIPTIVLLKDGKIAGASQGAMTGSQLEKWLQEKLPGLQAGEDDDDRSLDAENLPPIPSPERLEYLRSMAEKDAGNKEVLLEYCRALVFENPVEAQNLAKNIQEMDGGHWICEEIIALADLLSTDEENGAAGELESDIRKKLKSGELENTARTIVDNLLTAGDEEKEFLRKTGVSLFATLGDNHPVNKQYRKLFNMYLS